MKEQSESADTLFDKVPIRLESRYDDYAVNERIEILSGTFQILINGNKSDIEGRIYLEWLPSPLVKLEIVTCDIQDSVFWITALSKNTPISLFYSNQKIGFGYVIEIPTHKDYLIKCDLDQCYIGDKNIALSKVVFSVPNLCSFHGETLRNSKDENSFSKSRIEFSNDDHRIILDKKENYQAIEKETRNNCGYAFMYDGEITFNKEVSYEELHDTFWKFRMFLTFLNGRHTGCFLWKGYKGEDEVMFDFNVPLCNPYKTVKSWPSAYKIEGIGELWNMFYEVCKNEDTFDVIRSIVYFYCDSNSNCSLETSLIINQSIIELLWNHFIYEAQNKGEEVENTYDPNAIKKLKQLFKNSSYKRNILNGFPHLKEYLKKNGLYHLAFYVKMRNALVHGKRRHRDFYNDIPILVRMELRQFGLLFIEIIFLEILKFSGNIKNRRSHYWDGTNEL